MYKIILVIIIFWLYLLSLAIAMGFLFNNMSFECCKTKCYPSSTERKSLAVYFSFDVVATLLTLGLRCYNVPAFFQYLQNSIVTIFIALIPVFTTMRFCDVGEHVVYRISIFLSSCQQTPPTIFNAFPWLFWSARIMAFFLYYLFSISENITVAYTAPQRQEVSAI